MKIDHQDYLKSRPQSYWIASTKDAFTDYNALTEDIKMDAVIVGGGIAGITCAYLLRKEGLSVAVLEAGQIAHGTTGHTTAKITSQHKLIYDKLIKQMGSELAQQYATANETAIGEIRKLAENLNIDCDFIPQSAYVFTEKEEALREILGEVNAACTLGIQADYVDELPLQVPIKGGIRFDGQAQFHPLKYVLGLAKAFIDSGGKIYEQTRVVDIEEQNGFSVITAQGNKVTAERLIIASHYPFYNKHGMYFTRIYAEASYVSAIKASEKYPGGMYINLEDPVRSLRSHCSDDGELILIGGAKHKSGQGGDTTKNYEALMDYATSSFTVTDIPYRWSTQDCMTLDGLPYVGNFTSNTPNLYITTGFGKWGMTNSMSSAMILRDLIVKGDSPWKDVYNPSRQTMAASAINFVVENFNVAEKLVSGKIKPLSKEDIDILPGEGKAIELDGKRVGAYRDEDGLLYIVNTTCPHLGCELNWNPAERTWDCPCHGSRFDYQGRNIEGPAVKPLTLDEDVNPIGKLLTEDF